MFEIIPSPGTENKDWSEMEKRIEIVKPFVKTIHIDVVDGKFAPNTTFADPAPFSKYTKDIIFEVHLMVDEPIAHLQAWADAGFRRFIGQVEMMSDQNEFVAKAQTLGEVGLALDGKTPLEKLTVPLIDLDTILIMTINAGFSGQKLIAETLKKVEELASHNELPIEVDGGINAETIVQAARAGASRFVTTSAVYNGENPKDAYHELVKKLDTTVLGMA